MREAVQPSADIPKAPLLRALGLSRASFYRHSCNRKDSVSADFAGFEDSADSADSADSSKSAGVAATSVPCRIPGRALTTHELQAVRSVMYGEEFVDKTPTQIYAALLDRGVYHCSPRTMYRLLKTDGPCPPRTRNRTHIQYEKPELLATRPNQLWSWDITRLKGPAACHWYQLYVIIDVFSRYVVAWMVADRENHELAAQFIDQALATQNVQPGSLTIHADRGSAMTSKSVSDLLSDLGVTRTHSRPHVSNDNPYSEAQFKTLKYRPQFPARFGCIEDARATCSELFRWYNGEHYHGGIALLTPAAVHYGKSADIIAKRQAALDTAYRAHPERFVNRPPRHPALSEAVWINPPATPNNSEEEDKQT